MLLHTHTSTLRIQPAKAAEEKNELTHIITQYTASTIEAIEHTKTWNICENVASFVSEK